MFIRPRSFAVAALVLALASVLACGGGEVPSAGRWYLTCGDEVSVVDGSCPGWTAKTDVPPCTTQLVGGGCMTLAERCDPKDACNRLVVCATSDPTYQGSAYACPVAAVR